MDEFCQYIKTRAYNCFTISENILIDELGNGLFKSVNIQITKEMADIFWLGINVPLQSAVEASVGYSG
jgi:hypothetical protein